MLFWMADANGAPLVGVTVLIKGTQSGTATGANGSYSIKAREDQTLVFSYLGYTTVEEYVGKRTAINVKMTEEASQIGAVEIVNIGYGTTTRRDLTGSVAKADLGTMMKANVTNFDQALGGRIAGVVVTTGDGSLGAEANITIRGNNSLTQSNAPLYIIDGFPSEGSFAASINPADIESIDVLKDASAGAIYGTRAAGGVILITTKRAKQGSVTANYTGEFSFETVRKYPELLSSSEYIEYGLGEDYGADTDWYKELTNDAPFSQRHTVSIAGGTEVAQVYTSFMAQNQKGIVIGDNRKDYSGRINARFNLFDGVVEVRANAQFREAERDNRNSSGIFKMAFGLNPTIPLRDPANPSNYNVVGNGISGTSFNPVADIMLRTNNGKDQWLLADATVKINLMKGLSLQGTVGIDKRQYQQYTLMKILDDAYKRCREEQRWV